MTVGELTERELIARIQQQLPPAPDWLPVGIGDDAAAMIPERGRLQVLTVDALVDGVHFDRRFTPPDAIGHRALAANLSDLAAMGAAPRVVLLSLVLPPSLAVQEFDQIVAGIAALALTHRVHVAGGNLTASPGALVLDITAVGSAKPRQLLTRSGARPGDEIYVTGSIGGAAAGLAALQAGTPTPAGLESCVQRYRYPQPRVRMGLLLGRNRAAVSCTDLSDGLGEAVSHLAGAGGVGAVIDGDLLPIEPEAHEWFTRCGADPFDKAIAGGDDYELLITVRPRLRGRLRAAIRHGGVPLTRIGVCTEGRALVLRHTTDSGVVERPLPRGYHHFR
jgi:thiamine-monophosphate kinase